MDERATSPLDWVNRTPGKASSNIIEWFFSLIDEFIEKLSHGVENVLAWLRSIFDEIKTWVDEVLDSSGISKKTRKFIFKGFSNRFDDHINKGHIRVWVKHAQTGDPIEEYEYIRGDGGRSPIDFPHPKQAKVEVSGNHRHLYIDNKSIRITQVLETKRLRTGEAVEIVELEFYVTELKKWMRKKRPETTLWPKEWSLKKIKQVTKEAFENFEEINGRIGWGYSKAGVPVTFYLDEISGEIINAYIDIKKIKK